MGRAQVVHRRRDGFRAGRQFPGDVAGVAERSAALRAAPLRRRGQASRRSRRPATLQRRQRRVGRLRGRPVRRVAGTGGRVASAALRTRPRHADPCFRRRRRGPAAAALPGRRVLPRRLRAGSQPRDVVGRGAAAVRAARRSRRDARDVHGGRGRARQPARGGLRRRAPTGLREQAAHADGASVRGYGGRARRRSHGARRRPSSRPGRRLRHRRRGGGRAHRRARLAGHGRRRRGRSGERRLGAPRRRDPPASQP